FNVSWSQLLSLGITDDGAFTLTLDAVPDCGCPCADPAPVDADLTIDNMAPTLTISGAVSVDEGSSYTLNLSSSDPGADTISSWTINWGDGSQIVSGSPASVAHTFVNGNADYTITASATDEDGTFNATSGVAVHVNNVAPSNLSISTPGYVPGSPDVVLS